jgi:ABC-type amino acid transport system permease subunit
MTEDIKIKTPETMASAFCPLPSFFATATFAGFLVKATLLTLATLLIATFLATVFLVVLAARKTVRLAAGFFKTVVFFFVTPLLMGIVLAKYFSFFNQRAGHS